MTVSQASHDVTNNRLLRRSGSVCAVLLAGVSLINSANGQEHRAVQPTPRPQDRIVSPTYLNPPTPPAAAIPRLRPVPSSIIQASAQRVTGVEPQPIANVVSTEDPIAAVEPSEVPLAEASLGPGPDFASQLADDDSHMIQFIEVMQWTVLVLIIAVVGVVGLKKYGRGKLLTPQNSSIAHLATLPVKNFFQAHLLQIGSQKFLVTTDRTGVKTVNPINAWDDLDTSVADEQDVAIAA